MYCSLLLVVGAAAADSDNVRHVDSDWGKSEHSPYIFNICIFNVFNGYIILMKRNLKHFQTYSLLLLMKG